MSVPQRLCFSLRDLRCYTYVFIVVAKDQEEDASTYCIGVLPFNGSCMDACMLCMRKEGKEPVLAKMLFNGSCMDHAWMHACNKEEKNKE